MQLIWLLDSHNTRVFVGINMYIETQLITNFLVYLKVFKKHKGNFAHFWKHLVYGANTYL